jgi:hypothetical protein
MQFEVLTDYQMYNSRSDSCWDEESKSGLRLFVRTASSMASAVATAFLLVEVGLRTLLNHYVHQSSARRNRG